MIGSQAKGKNPKNKPKPPVKVDGRFLEKTGESLSWGICNDPPEGHEGDNPTHRHRE
jgi:hypothetical protein